MTDAGMYSNSKMRWWLETKVQVRSRLLARPSR